MAARVTLKYRDADFVTLTRTRSLPEPTAVANDLYHTVLELLSQLPRPRRRVRLLGIAASELTSQAQQQLSLFSDGMLKRLQAERAEDSIRARFGSRAITRAALLGASSAVVPDEVAGAEHGH